MASVLLNSLQPRLLVYLSLFVFATGFLMAVQPLIPPRYLPSLLEQSLVALAVYASILCIGSIFRENIPRRYAMRIDIGFLLGGLFVILFLIGVLGGVL